MEHGRELPPGSVVAGQWRIERMLKAGGFGIGIIARPADEGQTVPQIAETFGVHETTIYRCLTALEAKPLRAASAGRATGSRKGRRGHAS